VFAIQAKSARGQDHPAPGHEQLYNISETYYKTAAGTLSPTSGAAGHSCIHLRGSNGNGSNQPARIFAIGFLSAQFIFLSKVAKMLNAKNFSLPEIFSLLILLITYPNLQQYVYFFRMTKNEKDATNLTIWTLILLPILIFLI